MPMFGFSIGVSTLVGQAMGANKPYDASVATSSTVHIAIVYVCILIFIFLFMPERLISLFLSNSNTFQENLILINTGITLLKFVAVYLLFDSLVIIYVGALKGAGDSQFIMWSMILTGTLFLFIPVWFGVMKLNMGLYFVWSCVTMYLIMLFIIVFIRYHSGIWQKIRIIEKQA